MRLKSLEIQGYKSFATKVQFNFDQGITAIVGPNGCGKSNVADAIRWVLGEQSYSNLRGKKTEDMIFSGSTGRARLGMAAATLVLDNTDKWLPLDFSEVTISRRAYRSGENEYYLNGSRVRLRDVADLLAKSGLSRQTYTVIGQGTIDRVLSLHADERRTLFEEAAGITFHRKKRAETLARLDATRANLIRLNDIVKEIEPQLKRLEKQAERAEEYTHLAKDLEGLLRIWYGSRWRQSQLELRQAKVRLRQSETVVEAQRKELRELDHQISQLRTEQTVVRGRLTGWYTENNHLFTETEAVRRELAVSEERASQYAAQRAELMAELEPLQANLVRQEQLVAEARLACQASEAHVRQAEEAVRLAQQQVVVHQSRRQAVLDQQAEAERTMRRLEAALTERQTRLAQFAERRTTLQADQNASDAEIARLTEEQQQLQARQAELRAKLQTIDDDLAALAVKQSQQHDALAQLNQQAEELKTQIGLLEREEQTLQARQDLLGKLRTDMAGYYEGVRAVLQPESGLSGIVGTVSQIIQAPPELDVAIEVALGSRLQDVVTNSFAEAEAAIDYLKSTRRGRATFLPLDTIRVGEAAAVPDLPGVIGLASALVETESRLWPIVEQTLNRTVIVDDLSTARRVFAAMRGGFQIVTLAGELMRSGGAVTGGRTRSQQGQEGTFLAREREWREMPARLARLTEAQQELSTRLADQHDQAAAINRSIQSLAEVQQAEQAKAQELQTANVELNRLLEQGRVNLGWQQELKSRAAAELARLDQRQAEVQGELAALEQQRQQAEAGARQLAEQVAQLSAENLLAGLSQAEAKLAAVQSESKSQQAILASQTAAWQQLTGQIETKQARAGFLAAERESLLAQQAQLHSRQETFTQQLDQFSAKIREAEQHLTDLQSRQAHLEQTESGARQRLQWVESEFSRASLEAARRQDELDNLQRQIQDDLGLVSLEMSDEQVGQPVLPIHPLVSDLPVVEELPAGLEEDVRRLKVQMRRLGSINPEAPREYTALQERHDFLTGQIADLEAAAADLKEIIARLDRSMEESFTDTFNKVAIEFERYFKSLFGGGEARLLLTDPANLVDTGVEIVARPPGKRLQSLALLSGGERSLAAQALIFALLRISPTPFVIFDEVDAMLDEANVGRFREALLALAREIQFIVITHNRKTIEAANTIYGVSMGSDSVSQAYSLKIEDWVEEEKVRLRRN